MMRWRRLANCLSPSRLDVPRVGEDDPGRQRDVDVGRPEIGLGLVRVEVVRGSRRAGVAVAHEDLGSPVDEVLGGGPRRGAAPPLHVPGVEHVLLFHLRPEHDVLRIEVVDQDLGHDRLVPEHPPADAVAGEKAHQGVGLDGSPRSPLVTLRGGHAGPPVDEGDELARLGQDHVVSSGAVDGDQSQVGLGPMDPVAALGVAGGLPLEERTPVVHAVEVAVLEDGGVEGRGVFHGIVVTNRHPARQRRAEAQAGSDEPVDQQVIQGGARCRGRWGQSPLSILSSTRQVNTLCATS